MRYPLILAAVAVAQFGLPTSALAAWKAASPEVAEAVKNADVAAAITQMERLDKAVVSDDVAAFRSILASDLVVNNPQNGITQSGGTGRRGAAGQISYASYDRTIEHAGKLGDMVVIMGAETVVPKGENPQAGKTIHRRFTDIWRAEGDVFKLAVRQSTVVKVDD